MQASLLRASARGAARACLAAVFCLALAAPRAEAHRINRSYSTVTVTAESLEIVFRIDLSDLERALAVDANDDAVLTGDELLAALPGIHDLIASSVEITADREPLSLERTGRWFSRDTSGLLPPLDSGERLDFSEFDQAFVPDLLAADRSIYLHFSFAAGLDRLPAEVGVALDFFDELGDRHSHFLRFLAGGGEREYRLYDGERRISVECGGEVDRWHQVVLFTKLGVEHILIGYDHILFLVALIVVGCRFLSLVKIVTSFTVAHSVTLALAATGAVLLPERLVECGVALSIAYVAFENFFAEDEKPRWVVTFLFGLIHGFGFANVLGEIGLPTRGFVTALLSFNVGVELGQLAIVALAFPFTRWIARSKHRRALVFVVSAVVLALALGWFVERAFGREFMPF